MTNVLDVRALGVRFGSRQILKDLSFGVRGGATFAVIGPNGAGKTVLFKALIGAVKHEGEIRWAPGTRIGYVPQKLDIERNLPLTGWDFLRAKSAVTRVPPAEAGEALGLVGLSATVAAQPIGTLSGGQFQRLLLAFALMGNPTVLLVDEPTAGVDEAGEIGLFEAMYRMQQLKGLTVLLISHELSLIDSRVDMVLCLALTGGACLGPPMEILTPDRLREAYGTALRFHVHGDRGD